ncbi:tRNA uracil 4-sulfurtransferase ThiI [Pseudidiomarina andamanensis]|uniref:tRNA sulfurtransferase n=1 Tax=Pseudidiomarina andamanensis TaxID=1940690 RepID=A0AA92EW23_9GAMM|nr:tRNA uracil 4-sulfurtransferase ThiI [Pseudidiomarina andamanensis]MDS0219571.1 tRNA 4-thiouridine(8) synthase ThiI [Pseudidiomarina andamanensis]QGT95799.1 tRNA 4-thiouridine(8) synthase ThiI [Pseudidiomarina andamanensis]
MKFIVRLHAEITIKSKGVRKRYGKVLVNNLKSILRRNDVNAKVIWCWDRIEVVVADDAHQDANQVSEILQKIPGISWFSRSHELPLPEGDPTDFTPIMDEVLACWQDIIPGKSFAVRVKRKGEHPFRSLDLERYLGGAILKHCAGSKVSLKKPDVEVRVEIDHDVVRVFGHKEQGLGGFPLPTQETVLSLLSGGFDSSVASFQLIRRGARVHFCFFNLGGAQHETGVRQTAYYLWQQYASSHPLKFISIDFAPVVEEILTKVDNGLMGVVLKRQMLRAAEIVANNLHTAAIVTGEALGQVSSQTLSNLSVIDEATDKLVLRPLITMDKQEIINIAQQIGTADFARSMPEYCGVISNKPTVKAQRDALAEAESQLDIELIKQVVRQSRVEDVSQIGETTEQRVQKVDAVQSVTSETHEIIDIRSQDEVDNKPFVAPKDDIVVRHIPFFKLATAFADLDHSKTYLLYCEKGVMSKLQALYLQEQGYQNVAVYQPPVKK